MAGWPDLVTTALLGTDRRPVPAALPSMWATAVTADPTGTVLAHAARHRAATRSGVRPDVCAAPESAPDPVGDLAPPADQEVMADCLRAGDVAGVNAWLAEAESQQCLLVPELWTAAATLAASRRIDRAGLARALGERGVWFVARNPRWARLAATLKATFTEGAE